MVGSVTFDVWRDVGRAGLWATSAVYSLLVLAPLFLRDSLLGVRIIGYSEKNLYLSFKRPQYAREFASINGLVETVSPDGKIMYLPSGSKIS